MRKMAKYDSSERKELTQKLSKKVIHNKKNFFDKL